MDIITTHINADFDCLGSMIAAKRLYPDAEMVFPGGQERSLREFFLNSVQYAFGFKRVRDINLDDVAQAANPPARDRWSDLRQVQAQTRTCSE